MGGIMLTQIRILNDFKSQDLGIRKKYLNNILKRIIQKRIKNILFND